METFIRILLLYLLATLAPEFLAAQDRNKADSIRKIIEQGNLTKNDELHAYDRLIANTTSPEKILNLGERLLELAERANNIEYVLKAYKSIGRAYRLKGDLDKAIEFQFKAANNAIGKKEYLSFLAKTYAEISTCYTQNGDSENALLYGSRTIQILREMGSRSNLALSLLNYGYDYYLIGNYDSAMAYYNESEPILQNLGMTLGQAYIVGNRALVFWKQGNFSKAKKDLQQAVKMLEPLGDTYGIADYYNQLGNILMEERSYDQAIEYGLKSYEISEEEEFAEQARDACKLLFLSYQAKGDFERALDFQTKYYRYKDSIQNLETTQRLANLRTEFEVGKKQSEIDLLLEQKRSNQIIMITGGIILFISVCLIIVVYSYYKSKSRLSKQLEEQKNSLIKLNQTKDKFFSIISHDLRGPVGTLIGLVEVVKYFVHEGTKEKVVEMVDNMDVLVHRVNKLLDNLLTWALQQSGSFPYVPVEISIKQLFEDVTTMFKDTAMSKNVALTSSIDEDFDLCVDRNATLTILRNLVNNSIKFTPSGGHVKIDAKLDKENNYGVIKVTDDGVGIPKEKLENLFKLNEKISTPGTSGETGIGLGLQLVFDFVKLNKGKINVESEVKKGTIFTVSLPLA